LTKLFIENDKNDRVQLSNDEILFDILLSKSLSSLSVIHNRVVDRVDVFIFKLKFCKVNLLCYVSMRRM